MFDVAGNKTRDAPACNLTPELSDPVKITGYVMAWICAALYFCSRIPQVSVRVFVDSFEGIHPAPYYVRGIY